MSPGEIVGLVLMAAAVTVLLLAVAFPGALAGGAGWAHLTYLMVLLAAVAGSVILHWDQSAGATLRYAAIWIAIVLALSVGVLLWERYAA